jgi:oligoribonuclease
MTGLDTLKHRIVEMAAIVTDSDLNIIEQGPDIVIQQPPAVLADMNDWCSEHFSQSGLLRQIQESKISTRECELRMLNFVKKHTIPGKSPLCGNSIHTDRRFLINEMPEFTAHLHYQIVDVSTVKQLCNRWAPSTAQKAPVKKKAHRALEDILESIEELRFYRNNFCKVESSNCP